MFTYVEFYSNTRKTIFDNLNMVSFDKLSKHVKPLQRIKGFLLTQSFQLKFWSSFCIKAYSSFRPHTYNGCPVLKYSFDGSLKSWGIYFVWTMKVYTIAYAVKFTKTTRCRKVFMRTYHHHKIKYNNYICNGRQHKVKCGLRETKIMGLIHQEKPTHIFLIF